MIKEYFDVVKLHKQLNTVTTERDMLKETIKDELYKSFMAKLEEPLVYERTKQENKRLRQQVKTLKEIIKNGDVKWSINIKDTYLLTSDAKCLSLNIVDKMDKRWKFVGEWILYDGTHKVLEFIVDIDKGEYSM